MKIALIQLNAGQDKQENIKHACALVEKAAGEGSVFILLPEVFNYRGPLSGRGLSEKIAEDMPGESLMPLMKIAKKRGVNILAGSIYECTEEKNKVYNTSVIIDCSGSLVCKYRKINLFRAVIDGNKIDESQVYKAGNKPVICEILGSSIDPADHHGNLGHLSEHRRGQNFPDEE